MGTATWFVTHTHLDHIAALPVYVARRRLMKMEPPTIYLPEHAVPLVERLLHVISRLDRGRLPCELIAVRPGDEIELSRELVVTAAATRHTVPSLGYVVWERRRKLKAEFGRDIVFWGGGVDTQKTLAFGTPAEVRAQVLERCEIFGRDGGFVFNAVHNVQANVPLANIVAMFQALGEFNGRG